MQRDELIAQYEAGIAEVLAAVEPLSDDDLDREPAGGGWTARQVVHHLADSEMTSAIRIRRLLAEDAPDVGAYDEAAFAIALRYTDRPIGPALKAFTAARETTAQLLHALDDEQWERAGTHPEHGRYSVDDWLRIYAAHAHDHAAQIREAAGTSDPP